MNAPRKRRDLICAFIGSCLVLLSDAKGDLNADAKSLYWEGDHLAEQGTRESLLKAIEKYKEALRLFQQLGDTFNQGMTLHGMGHSYAGLGDLQSAVTCFEQDAQSEEQLKYYGNEGVTLVDLGYTYLKLANLEKASAAFQRARALLYMEAERDSLYYKDIADALDGLAQIEDKRGNAKSALAYMMQAADAARKFGNKTTLAKKLGAAGIMAQKLGQFDLAEPLLTEVLALWQELGSKDNQGMALFFLAKCREGKGDYRGAIDYYRKRAAIQHELNLIRNEANTYVDMALLAQKIPDLDQALIYFEKAKSLFGDAIDKHSQAILHFYVGVLYSQRKDLEKAIGELKPAADLFAELTDQADEATARLAWADAIYQNSGVKQDAIDQYSKAADLFQKLNKPGPVATCYSKMAQLLTDLGKIDEAIAMYRQAISLLETTPDNQELGQDWFGLGSIYQQRGDRSEELAAFSRAQPYLQKANDTLREGIVLLRLSSIYTEEVQIEKALFYDRRAAELFRQIGNQQAEAESLYGVAVSTLYLGKLRNSIEAAQQAIIIWKQLNDVKQLGACLLILGRAKLNSGDGGFLQDLEDAVRYSKSAGDPLTEAEALSNLGLAYTLADHFNEAQQDFDDALQLVRKKSDSKLEGQILSNLGLTYLLRGDRQTAIDYLINAIRLLHSVGDHSGEADTLNTLGLLYSQLGDDEQGLSYFQRALGLYRELNDSRRQGLALNGIGVLLIRLQRNGEALNYFQQAADLTVNLDKLQDVKLQTEQNIAFAMDLVGEHQDAQKNYLNLLTTVHDSGNRRLEATILGNLGASYLRTADYENARAVLKQSLSLRTAAQDHDGLVLALASLSELERSTGRLDVARSLIEKALAEVDWLRNKVALGDLRASYSASLQDLNEFHIALLMQLHEVRPTEGFDRLAFEASERGRARALVELLREARVDIQQEADSESWQHLIRLQHELSAKEQFYTSLSLGQGSDEALQKLRTDINGLASESLVVEDEIRKKNPRYAALTGNDSVTLPEVQRQLLDGDTVLLEFALGAEGSFLWVISKNDIRSFHLAPRKEIEELVKKTVRQFANQATTYDDKNSAPFRLSDLLLGQAAPLLSGKRLLIVPDGALNYLPFAALPDPADLGQGAGNDPRPLIVNHELVSLPSASALIASRAQRGAQSIRPKTMMIFADPVFSKSDSRVHQPAVPKPAPLSNQPLEVKTRGMLREFSAVISLADAGDALPRLEGTRTEAMKIAAMLPADQVTMHLDFDATRAAALSPDLFNYRFVHFSTHGVIDSDRPAFSALALSLVDPDGNPKDGFLNTSDFFNLKLRADLTTLSGCETGLGKELRGEGVLGLTRGCLYAGSERVLVSLWKVSDPATAKLMSGLYSRILNGGATPAAALREAQLAMFNDPATKAPFYWAAFILEGEWQ